MTTKTYDPNSLTSVGCLITLDGVNLTLVNRSRWQGSWDGRKTRYTIPQSVLDSRHPEQDDDAWLTELEQRAIAGEFGEGRCLSRGSLVQ